MPPTSIKEDGKNVLVAKVEEALRDRPIPLSDIKKILYAIRKEDPESSEFVAQVLEELDLITIPFRPRNPREDAQRITQLEGQMSELESQVDTLVRVVRLYQSVAKGMEGDIPQTLEMGLSNLRRLNHQLSLQYQEYAETLKDGGEVIEIKAHIHEIERLIRSTLQSLESTGVQIAFEVAETRNVLGSLTDIQRGVLPEELQEFQIVGLFDELKTRYQHMRKPSIHFSNGFLQDERADLKGDSGRVYRALTAFIDAAIDHIPEEERMAAGKIEVELKMDRFTNPPQIRIIIADTGVSGKLPAESAEAGLLEARNTIRKLGGKVEILPNEKGNSFEISLPIATYLLPQQVRENKAKSQGF